MRRDTKKYHKVLVLICILVISIGLPAYCIVTLCQPVQLQFPKYTEIEIGHHAVGLESVVLSSDEEMEVIAELMESTTFKKSLKQYRDSPPMPYYLEATFKDEGDTVMHMWLVMSNWYRMSDYIILRLTDSPKYIALESSELQNKLMSYIDPTEHASLIRR